LLLPRGLAFIAGRSQADYLRPLRFYLERLIAKIGFLSFCMKTGAASVAISITQLRDYQIL